MTAPCDLGEELGRVHIVRKRSIVRVRIAFEPVEDRLGVLVADRPGDARLPRQFPHERIFPFVAPTPGLGAGCGGLLRGVVAHGVVSRTASFLPFMIPRRPKRNEASPAT